MSSVHPGSSLFDEMTTINDKIKIFGYQGWVLRVWVSADGSQRMGLRVWVSAYGSPRKSVGDGPSK